MSKASTTKNPKLTKTANARDTVYDVIDMLDIMNTMEHVQKKFKLAGATIDPEVRRSTCVSTGLLMEDLLLGGGVFPGGWYTIFGAEQSAKSTNMMSLMTSFYRSSVPLLLYYDAEGCVTEDTTFRVNGKDIPLKELVSTIDPSLLEAIVDSGQKTLIPDSSIPVDTIGIEGAVDAALYYGGIKPTTKITLAEGQELEGYHHPVLVLRDGKEQWVNIEDVKVGDLVGVPD